MTCPICHKSVEPKSRFRPFCSERCKLLDLSRWFGEEYRIPGPPDLEAPEPDSDSDESDVIVH